MPLIKPSPKYIFARSAIIGAALAASCLSPALADSETEALRAQIKLLEARLDQLEKKQEAAKEKPVAATGKPGLEKHLEKRLEIVEREQKLTQDAAKEKAEKTPSVEVGPKGLLVTSPDKQYSLRMRAFIQADTRTFQDNRSGAGVDNFLIRNARAVFDAKLTDYFSIYFVPDFVSSSSRFSDAYVDFKPVPSSKLFNLRLGKQKVPVGLERWQSEQDMPFVERGLPNSLVPSRDTGLMAYGDIIPGHLEYNIGFTNGTVDLGDNSSASSDNKDFNARLFARPFHSANIPLLKGLGFGVAGTYGEHKGTTSAQNLTAGYVTPGQARFFTYRNTSFADGSKWRFNPQASYYNGPFSLIGEYVLNSQELTNAGNHDTINNQAWTAIAGYVLTGEDAGFYGVKPARNFDWEKGNWGAFEVLARLGELKVDKAAFGAFSDPAVSARQAREATIGATWYFNSSLKLNVNYSHTSFDGGAAGGGNRNAENVLMTRTQFRF